MNRPPNTAQLAAGSLTRHAMTAGGVAGLVSSQDEILKLVSLIITTVGLAWSIYEKISRKGGGSAANLFLAVCGIATAGLLTGGCALFSSPEQSMLTIAQTSHTTSENALARWNEWLGFQRNQMLLMQPADAQHRLEELQAIERRVMAAVDEINRAKRAAAEATDLYYDALAAVTRTNAPPGDVTAARRLVEDANAILSSAERALLNILTLYIPNL